MAKQLQVGAVVPLNLDDVRQAVANWIKAEYGIEVVPNVVQFDYEYDRHNESNSLNGAHVDLDREQLKALLNKDDKTITVVNKQ